MEPHTSVNISHRQMLKGSALAAAAGAMAISQIVSASSHDQQKNVEKKLINNGKIEQINDKEPVDTDIFHHDIQETLAVPSFSDMPVHIDKTNDGNPWQAFSNVVSVRAKIREEQQELPDKLRLMIRVSVFGLNQGISLIWCLPEQAVPQK